MGPYCISKIFVRFTSNNDKTKQKLIYKLLFSFMQHYNNIFINFNKCGASSKLYKR